MVSSKATSADPKVCPLCGKANECAMAENQGKKEVSCWCSTENIPENLLARVPESAIRRACICRNCIALHKGDE
ncbi:MAG TPA: hypothetical protein ENI65_11100 [Gammaproteobacteria bacterium]|nr:hypothetical protein [Gammaproteobacteria bacterium]